MAAPEANGKAENVEEDFHDVLSRLTQILEQPELFCGAPEGLDKVINNVVVIEVLILLVVAVVVVAVIK